jgi:hypothetical protein
MQRTRTTPVIPSTDGASAPETKDLQPVAISDSPGVLIETRPDTPETRAEDEQSDRELAEELSAESPPNDEIWNRQERNRKFWSRVVHTIASRMSDEETIIDMADTLTKAYDARMESGWFGHQHEEFFNKEEE